MTIAPVSTGSLDEAYRLSPVRTYSPSVRRHPLSHCGFLTIQKERRSEQPALVLLLLRGRAIILPAPTVRFHSNQKESCNQALSARFVIFLNSLQRPCVCPAAVRGLFQVDPRVRTMMRADAVALTRSISIGPKP